MSKLTSITLMAFGLGAWVAPSFVLPAKALNKKKIEGTGADWPGYGGEPAQDHYSSLSQINRKNVGTLKVAWTVYLNEKGNWTGSLQSNPVIVGRVLYTFTPSLKVIALDAATGKLIWKFDSGIDSQQPSRGVSYWTDGKESRLFAGIMNYLYALDPATGKPIESFGEGGRIDLRKNLRGDYRVQSIALTSPGVIYKDLIIVGGRNPESEPAPPGDIRAFDVHTGALRWVFHTIPHPGEPGYDTWPKDAWKTAGAANNWAGMTLDVKRGIVYVPTGSAVSDFYGADRVGNDLFADCLLALDASTGKLIWYFQGVHHDIWDRDFPSRPALLTVTRNGKKIDAIAQTTKQGWVFLFDRTNGEPLFPIEERKFPASTVPGEVTSPTQPVPLLPAPYARQRLTEDLLTNRTPEAHAWAVKEFRKYYSDGPFVPLRAGQQTVVFPGFDGGAEWGGPALDPNTGVIYINSNDIAETGSLVKNNIWEGLGVKTYQSQCAVCHGANRTGSPPEFPSLVNVFHRYAPDGIVSIVHHGRGRMPGFPGLQGEQLDALLEYLRTGVDNGASGAAASGPAGAASAKTEMASNPAGEEEPPEYFFDGYRRFDDPDGYPAVAELWGTLNAINLNTGKYLWKIPFGTYPAIAAQGLPDSGSENYGGPVITASGVLIIAATSHDRKIRAFNSQTGKLLWEATLPYDGVATPSTYMVDGKQYIVIGACGARDKAGPQGAAYVAFTLP